VENAQICAWPNGFFCVSNSAPIFYYTFRQ
jgi:hypothetical protein